MSHVLARSKTQSFSLKGPLFNDPNTFFILLFLINSALFSFRGLDFGTCVIFGPWTQADWIRPGLPAIFVFLSLSLYLYLSMYVSICPSFYLSLSIYLSIYLSFYLSVTASRKNVRCVWRLREASTRLRTWCKYSFCQGAGPYADM